MTLEINLDSICFVCYTSIFEQVFKIDLPAFCIVCVLLPKDFLVIKLDWYLLYSIKL